MQTEKTRDAAIETLCVPCLELGAGILGEYLAETVTEAFKDSSVSQKIKDFELTNSQMTLNWIQVVPRNSKTFWTNRLAKNYSIVS